MLDKIIENMSLNEKVGQLFQIGFSGKEATPEIEEMIKKYKVGGIIYFSRNIDSPAQLAKLSNNLQKMAVENYNLPLMISADQEGGTVTRLKRSTHFPGNMTLGATRDSDLAYRAGKATAGELENVGINMNLAPVLDVNNNPNNPVIGVRSYGEDPELVAKLGTSYIKGMQEGGVIACGKHFPGHGDTDTDSHLDLPIIKHDRKRLDSVELFPFREAIKTGIDSIMTAHINFPTIEPKEGLPATLSKKVLTGLLREELGFEGLIITDCMEMSAIVNTFGTVEGSIKTLEAGSDTVLVSHSYKKQRKSIEAVISAVEKGRISEERINNSVKRILKLKQKRIGLEEFKEADYRKIDKDFSMKVAEEIAEKGVTLVQDRDDLIPLTEIKDKKIGIIDFNMGRVSLVEDDTEHDNKFVNYLKDMGADIDYHSIDEGSKLDIDKLNIDNMDLAIICTYNAIKRQEQADIANKVGENLPVIVLALRNPYDYEVVSGLSTYITTYDYSPANLKAAARIISGELQPSGQLPVTLVQENR